MQSVTRLFSASSKGKSSPSSACSSASPLSTPSCNTTSHRIPIQKGPAGFGFAIMPWMIIDLSGKLKGAKDVDQCVKRFGFVGNGCPVKEVYPGSNAESAGLQRWDVIVGINGNDVTKLKGAEVRSLIVGTAEEITLDVVRALVDEADELQRSQSLQICVEKNQSGFGFSLLCMSVQNIKNWNSKFGKDTELSEGCIVQDVFDDSPAEWAGLRPYDVIVGINGKDVARESVDKVQGLIKKESRMDLNVVRIPNFNMRLKEISAAGHDITRVPDAYVRSVVLIQRPSEGGYGFSLHTFGIQNIMRSSCSEMKELLGFASGIGGWPVAKVMAASAAENSGLRLWDVITRINGKDITTALSCYGVQSIIKAADELKLEVIRDEAIFDRATSMQLSPSIQAMSVNASGIEMEEQFSSRPFQWVVNTVDIHISRNLEYSLGISLFQWSVDDLNNPTTEMTSDMLQLSETLQFARAEGGVGVSNVEIESQAHWAGLRKWDVIIEINRRDVRHETPWSVWESLHAEWNIHILVIRDDSLDQRTVIPTLPTLSSERY